MDGMRKAASVQPLRMTLSYGPWQDPSVRLHDRTLSPLRHAEAVVESSGFCEPCHAANIAERYQERERIEYEARKPCMAGV